MSRAIRLALLCTLVVAGGCSQNMLASGAKGGEPKLKPMAPEIRVDGSKITMTVPACRLDQLLPLVGGKLGLDLKSAPELGHAILLTRVEDESSESVLNRIADAVDGRWEGNRKSRVLVPDPKKAAANSEKLVQALIAKQENLARFGRGGSLRSSTYKDYVSPEDSSVHFLSKVVPHLDMRKLAALPDLGTYVLTTSKDTLGDPMPPDLVKTLVRMAKVESDWPSDESYRSRPEAEVLKSRELRLTVTRQNMGRNVQFDIGWALTQPPSSPSIGVSGTLSVSLSDLAGSAIAMSENPQEIVTRVSNQTTDTRLASFWREFGTLSNLWKEGGERYQYDEAVELIGDPTKYEPLGGTISKAILHTLESHRLETVTVLPDSLIFLPLTAEDMPQNANHIALAVEQALLQGSQSSSVKKGWWSIDFSVYPWQSVVSDRKNVGDVIEMAQKFGPGDFRTRMATYAAINDQRVNPGDLAWQMYGPPFGIQFLKMYVSGLSTIRALDPKEIDLLAEGKEVTLSTSDPRAKQLLDFLSHRYLLKLKTAPEIRPEYMFKDVPREFIRLDRSVRYAQADVLDRSQFPSEITIRRTTHKFFMGRSETPFKEAASADHLGAIASLTPSELRSTSENIMVFSKVVPMERTMERITFDIGNKRVASAWTTLSEKDISSKALPPAEIGGEWAKQYQKGKREWTALRAEEELLRTKSPGEIMDDLLRKQSQEK